MQEEEYPHDWTQENKTDSAVGYKYFEHHAKSDVNDLLWKLMPNSMTLGELDKIANDIFELLDAAWERTMKKVEAERELPNLTDQGN